MIVFGDVEEGAIQQLATCLEHPRALAGVLMPDGHLGYSMPIGGVIAYDNCVSPSGVGFDIACGNKAVRLDLKSHQVLPHIEEIMDTIVREIAFGVGRNNPDDVEDQPVFQDSGWEMFDQGLRQLAINQFGTVGGGNHYVDVFSDEDEQIWVGVHFGSRGFGHKVASGYLNLAAGKPFDARYQDSINSPGVVLDLDTPLGLSYWQAMHMAGFYAYAARDYVCEKVARILGGAIVEEVHNHHNFAWEEYHDELGKVVVVRKGATPAHLNQKCFVGSTMAEESVILLGCGDPKTLRSAVHGAGRVMARHKAKGNRKKGKPGLISQEDMGGLVNDANVCLRGADVDEAPQCYKRLDEVLSYIPDSVDVIHRLRPIGVVMAGSDIFDPYKD